MHTCPQIAGFVVGLIPLVRRSIIGDAAPLRVIQDTALLLGYEAWLAIYSYRSHIYCFFYLRWRMLNSIILIFPCGYCRDGAIPAVTLIMGGNLLKGTKKLLNHTYFNLPISVKLLLVLTLFFFWGEIHHQV